MESVMKEERCGVENTLVHAHCLLRPGHEGPHWGHGPTWEWSETTCRMVEPTSAVPERHQES